MTIGLFVCREIQIVSRRIKVGKPMQRERSASLQQTEHHYRILLESLHNIVYKVQREADGRFVYTMFEGKVAKQHGLTTEQVKGKTAHDVFEPAVADYLQEYYETAWYGRDVVHEFTCGTEIYYVSLISVVGPGDKRELIGCSLDLTLCRQAKKQIEYVRRYDALTGLPNQFAFDDCLTQVMKESRESGDSFALVIVDIDKFKMMHASIGRTSSNVVLEHVVKKLVQTLGEETMLARLSKDNFAAVVKGPIQKETLEMKARQIIAGITSPIPTNNAEIYVTASVGISRFPQDGEESEELLKKAETAMYRAKEKGGNCHCFYSEDMMQIGEKWALCSELRKAVNRNELLLHYQPRYAVETNEMIGMEALVRWRHKQNEVLSPGKFIDLAEKTGIILEIDRWVLEQACAQVRKWQKAGKANVGVSVNLSSLHFKEPNCVETIMEIVRRTELPPSCLEVEITESVLIDDTNRMGVVMQKLRDEGIRIAIDDFGTGYSALHYLKKFPVDTLKIDRSFLENVTCSEVDDIILCTVIEMAKKLKLRVVAEGVETEEQLAYLRDRACDEVQGYLLSRPLPVEQVEALLFSSAT
jgi:diguanylate cyclase (GGDEF)-like protein